MYVSLSKLDYEGLRLLMSGADRCASVIMQFVKCITGVIKNFCVVFNGGN